MIVNYTLYARSFNYTYPSTLVDLCYAGMLDFCDDVSPVLCFIRLWGVRV